MLPQLFVGPTTGEREAFDAVLLIEHKHESSCTPPLCKACQLARMKRWGAGMITETWHPDQPLKEGVLQPGELINMDQYESTIHECLTHKNGKEPKHLRYCGGSLFSNNAMVLVVPTNQVSLREGETVQSLKKFAHLAATYGVHIQKFYGDNGVYAFVEFQCTIENMENDLYFSDVDTHHQNGVAKNSIQVVLWEVRAMVLRAAIQWTDQALMGLWPFAME